MRRCSAQAPRPPADKRSHDGYNGRVTYSDNPVVCLLESRRARQGLDKLMVGSVALAALLGGPVALYEGPALGLAAAGAVLLIVFPFLRAQADAGLLVSLRNGGCLEELRQTSITSWEMVDGTTWHTLQGLVKPGLAIGVVATCLAWTLITNPYWRPVAVGAAIAWFPTMLLLAWAQAYFSQMLAAWAQQEGSGWTQLLGFLVVVGPLVPAVPIGLLLFAQGDAVHAAEVLIGCCIWTASLSRLGAGVGLAQADRVHQAIKSRNLRKTTRNPWVAPWSDNPIVVRECARDGGRRAGGLLGLVLAENLAAVCLAWLPWVLVGTIAPDSPLQWWVFVFCFGAFYLVQPTRVASRVGGAMVQERERRTLETLAVTRLSTAEFVDGWAQVGWRPRLIESVVALPMFAALGLMCHLRASEFLPALPLLLVNLFAGAYLGFAIGVVAPNRMEASGDVAVLLMLGMTLAVAAGLVYTGTGLLLTYAWLYVVAATFAVLARWTAIRALS